MIAWVEHTLAKGYVPPRTPAGKFVDVVMPADLAELGKTAQHKFLACHSMGCAVSFTWLIDEYEAQRDVEFSAVAANAPLVKPFTDPFPYSVAVGIGTTMVSLGMGEWCASR